MWEKARAPTMEIQTMTISNKISEEPPSQAGEIAEPPSSSHLVDESPCWSRPGIDSSQALIGHWCNNMALTIPPGLAGLSGPDYLVLTKKKKKKKAVKDTQACVHFDKGLNLDKVLDKIKSSRQIKCEECKKGVYGKKDIFSSDKRAIWLCLDCGCYLCGGVGLPTGAQSHVARHLRLTRHRLVIQWENPQLRWCLPCYSLLPVEKEMNGEKKDVLSEVVKLIKGRSWNNLASSDIEDQCSGSGSITSDIRLEGAMTSGIEAKNGYVVRGLVNLGNTCFFNSISQNLLSLDQLRNHFLKEDGFGVGGPLASSLKKLFAETKPEAGLKSVINPRAFFGSFCSKVPQFRGYDQHDSHELLRCLLDSLSTEESDLRKKRGDSDNDQKSTLIDSIFGGETSSIVSCMECGHSSKVYEPFFDLSLPVPFKKTPPKKPQTVSRAKIAKLPPKRFLKNVSKVSNVSKALPSKALSESATPSDTGFDSFWLDFIGPKTSGDETNLNMQKDGIDNILTNEANQIVPGPNIPATSSVSSGDQTLESMTEKLIQDSEEVAKVEGILEEKDVQAMQSDVWPATSSISVEVNQASCIGGDPGTWESSSSVNPWDEEELPLVVADSQILYMPYKEISCDDNTVVGGECEASSSFVIGDHEPQNNDFVDFSGFFDEPEMSEGPVFGPPSKAEASGVGFMVFSSESDPDEIDDSDSLMSVERCLAHFTKPEILSNDNAWHCENCSKNLKLQRLREKEKSKKKDEYRSSNTSKERVKENDIENEVGNGVFRETDVVAVMQDPSDTCRAKDHSSNGRKATKAHSANESDSEGAQDEDEDSEKLITVKRDATKRVLINKAPPVLTIHLKRFSQDLCGSLSKSNGHVSFKEVIDLREYMDSRCNEEDPPVYRLSGLVEHSGTMRGGHYVAYVRGVKETDSSSKVWYNVSDADVRQVSLEKVLHSEAYILFYERIFSQD